MRCLCAFCAVTLNFISNAAGDKVLVEQVYGFECQLALSVRDAVIGELKKAGRLKPYFQPRSQLETPMQLSRMPHPLFGRESDVQQVKDSLQHHRAAVIWGGPGEGKSSIAMEAGCQLWSGGKCPGGCFVVDMLGMIVPNASAYFLVLLVNSTLSPKYVQACRSSPGRRRARVCGWACGPAACKMPGWDLAAVFCSCLTFL